MRPIGLLVVVVFPSLLGGCVAAAAGAHALGPVGSYAVATSAYASGGAWRRSSSSALARPPIVLPAGLAASGRAGAGAPRAYPNRTL